MAHTARLLAPALVGLIALTGCNSAGSAGSSAGSSAGAGAGEKTLVIATDMPLQGPSKDVSDSTNNSIKLYLKQIGNKAGKFSVDIKVYDDSTAAKGTWDDAQCAANAQAHVANADEVAVMGTSNSGCAKIELPILNQDTTGPIVMVSNANTNPGLTKAWDPGEPDKYYPSGVRNYARTVTTDDYQGAAAATFLAGQGVKSVYILNDNQTYGQGVAASFAEAAKKAGMNVLGNEPWDAKQTSYQSLFTKIKATSPQAVYLAGLYDNNGGQLVKDKVAVLGDNSGVKLMAPDGFVGFPELQKLPQGEGIYLTFAGLTTDQLSKAGGVAAKLISDYKAEYGKEMNSAFSIYGVAAVQVILAAIEKSDGTRKGIRDAIFTEPGITIPAAASAIGKEFTIDPKTGDISTKDISVLQLRSGVETFDSAQAVGG